MADETTTRSTARGAPLRPVLAAAVFFAAAQAGAHVPHDVVEGLVASPAFESDATAFAIVRGNLLRTTDGGRSWHRLTRGFWRKPTALAISPAFPSDKTLYLGTDLGVYRSSDAGLHWKRRSSRLGTRRIARVLTSRRPEEASLVFALTEQGDVFRSADAGDRWTQVLRMAKVTALAWSEHTLIAGLASGRLRRSTDSGVTWSQYGRTPDGSGITALVSIPVPGQDQRIFVGTKAGLYATLPGQRWQRLAGGLPEEPIVSVASIPEEGSVVLLATTRGQALFRSGDFGASWERFDAGLVTEHQAEIQERPQFSEVVVTRDGAVFVAGYAGVFYSADRGRSFEELPSLPTGIIVGLALSPAVEDGYHIGIVRYGEGFLSKSSGERVWRAALSGQRLGSIAYSPDFANDRMVLTSTFYRVFRSVDGGGTWERVPVEYEAETAFAGCPGGKPPGPPPERVARAPFLFGERFATDLVFSPAFAKDRTIFAAYRPEGVLRSVDGGKSFSKIWHGCGRPVWSIVVSPEYPEDGTLFASMGDGVYRSRDRGKSWKHVGSAPRFSLPGLAVSPRFGSDRTLYASGAGGLWRSRDGGDTWQPLEIGSKHHPVAVGGLVVSPFSGDPRELLVQLVGGGLYHCLDDGETFEARELATPAEFSQMRDFDRDRSPLLAFSPNYPADGTLYAASMDRLFESTDRGRSWHEVTEIRRTSGSGDVRPSR